jgi:hypothetical protein
MAGARAQGRQKIPGRRCILSLGAQISKGSLIGKQGYFLSFLIQYPGKHVLVHGSSPYA